MTDVTLKSRLKRLIKRINDDDVFGRAAQLSYYFLLALFPLLLVLINLLGFMAQRGTEFRVKLISYLGAVMPSSAVALVHTTLDEGERFTTTNFNVNLTRPLKPGLGLVIASGVVVHCGRQGATAEGRIVDSANKLLAHGTTTCVIFAVRKQD